MTEVFYDISHLTTDQLRELFTTYRRVGWIDYQYEVLDDTLPPIQPLTDAEIILNIEADDEKNYFVFMLDHEEEEDGVMIGFGLSYHEDFSAYLHLAPKYLDELVKKYALVEKPSNEENVLSVEEYLISQVNNISMN